MFVVAISDADERMRQRSNVGVYGVLPGDIGATRGPEWLEFACGIGSACVILEMNSLLIN